MSNMDSNNLNSQVNEIIEVQCQDRWQVYHRLQELEIACWCSGYQPLRVEVTSATKAIQVWSVAQHTTLSRRALIPWLEACWQLCSAPEKEA